MMNQFEIMAEEGLPEKEELLTMEGRARFQWLIDHTAITDQTYFAGGSLSLALYKASRYCYVQGHYPASLAFGLAYFQNNFRCWFEQNGRSDLVQAGLGTLIQKALIAGLITDRTANIIERANQKRKSLSPLPAKRETARGEKDRSAGNIPDERITETDAQKLMDVMMQLMTGKT